MVVVVGYVGKIGAVSGAEPVGRVTIVNKDDQSETIINCASGPRFEIAKLARETGQLCEVDVLATTNPMVADKVRLL